MKLEDFKPIAQCVTPQTKVQQAKFPVFDIHMHLGKLLNGQDYQQRYNIDEFMSAMKALNIHSLVNLDGFYDDDLDQMLNFTKDYHEQIFTFIWINLDDIDNPEKLRNDIIKGVDKGAWGIKMWKDITLYKGIRTDDPRLDIVYETAAEYNLPILIHIADPVAFFEPLNEYNERYEELSQNPDWYFGDHTKYPTFKEMMEMQENMIKNHPETQFIVAHVGSCGEDLGYVASQLDLYPNLHIDIAARIAELGRVPYTAREFFIKYQDRILFGTDATPLSYDFIPTYFRFLETKDEYFPYQGEEEIPGQGRWAIYGLYLPDEVLEKVYNKNAKRIFKLD